MAVAGSNPASSVGTHSAKAGWRRDAAGRASGLDGNRPNPDANEGSYIAALMAFKASATAMAAALVAAIHAYPGTAGGWRTRKAQ